MGVPKEVKEIILDSPFDYRENVRLYIAGSLPDPSQKFQEYQEASIEEMKQIISLTRGRTFILFTSFRTMDYACNKLKDYFEDLNIIKQGDFPRYKLLQIFQSRQNVILLGTNTFWQGIDVPGQALECVIISKLPFSVPDEPIVQARMEKLIAKNIDPFMNYQIPQAVIMLRQGFGRLIRTKKDRGIVAILDPRIKTRFYGRNFIKSLPKCQIISKIEEIENFFAFL